MSEEMPRKGSDKSQPDYPLLLLALRCEREEPDVYLASAILVACGHQTLYRGINLQWEWRKNGAGIWSPMPRPDLSLDAAVTLVPEGWRVNGLEQSIDGRWWDCYLAPIFDHETFASTEQGCKTAALALCAAALRARAAMAKDEAQPARPSDEIAREK